MDWVDVTQDTILAQLDAMIDRVEEYARGTSYIICGDNAWRLLSASGEIDGDVHDGELEVGGLVSRYNGIPVVRSSAVPSDAIRVIDVPHRYMNVEVSDTGTVVFHYDHADYFEAPRWWLRSSESYFSSTSPTGNGYFWSAPVRGLESSFRLGGEENIDISDESFMEILLAD